MVTYKQYAKHKKPKTYIYTKKSLAMPPHSLRLNITRHVPLKEDPPTRALTIMTSWSTASHLLHLTTVMESARRLAAFCEQVNATSWIACSEGQLLLPS